MKTISKINRVYIIYIINVNCILTVKHFIIITVKLNNFIIKLNISAEFADLANVFSQKKTDILSLFNKNVYMINLNDNELFFKSLYNLLTSELKIIKMYLNIYLTKK
jgi:hypothetical protein